MKISLRFLERNAEWCAYLTESAKTAGDVLSDRDFLERVRNHRSFDFTDKTPAEIADLIAKADDVAVAVAFKHAPWRRWIAAEDPSSGTITFNTAKRARGAGTPGNIAHEVMHVLGFAHHGNKERGNENSVPYRIGYWVDEALVPGQPDELDQADG
jgi:hypothetical protein